MLQNQRCIERIDAGAYRIDIDVGRQFRQTAQSLIIDYLQQRQRRVEGLQPG